MPASSCMLPANTACFGVFVLWTNRKIKTEGHVFIQYLKYIERKRENERERARCAVQRTWNSFKGIHKYNENFWKWIELCFCYFLLVDTLLLCAFATIIGKQLWHLNDSFRDACFKETRYLLQDQTQNHSLYRQIESQQDGKRCKAATIHKYLQAQGRVWQPNTP